MILKSLEEVVSTDRFSIAGDKAEKQMAFYLDRAFAKDSSIFVLNGIRLKRDNDVCQIDHLIVHDFGMVIVESKSVTSKVKINEDGSWERFWEGKYIGMASPVLQAERQGKLLKEFLNAHNEQLLKKILGRQQTFNKMTIDVIVAISDRGRIERSEHAENESVFKADQVTGKIEEIYATQKKLDNLLNFSVKLPDWTFAKERAKEVADFIVANNSPLGITARKKAEPQKQKETKGTPKVPDEQKIHTYNCCPECRGKISIRWGNKCRNYYWHCNDCGRNVSINYNCPECAEKLKIRKQNQDYFIYCEPCKLEVLYHSEANE